MRSAYIGLVSRHGLDALFPENSATRRWSLAAARRRRSACLWAHVDAQLAAELADLVERGEGAAALRALTEYADTIGPLV